MPNSSHTKNEGSNRSLIAAGLLGAATGMRTMTPPAVLAASGRRTAPRAVTAALLLAAAGELVGDKLPNAPSRTMPIALAGRMGIGAVCGWLVAGPIGAVLATATAGTATFLGHDARVGAVKRSGLPDLPFALAEDVIAISSAIAGARLAGPGLP